MRYKEILNEHTPISHYRTLLKSKWELPTIIENYLKDNGYTKIGEGIYSFVYGRPGDNIVIKIGGISLDDALDDPWVDYVEWLGRHQNNIHFPRVGKVRWHTAADGKKFYIAPIERLVHDNSTASYLGNFISIIDNWLQTSNKLKDMSKGLYNWYSWNKDFVKAYIMIRKQFPDFISDLSFNSNNIMFRGNVPVISDPLAFRQARS